MFCKKGDLKNFTKFTGKHLCQSLFFNKVAGLRPATSLRKKLWHRCFTVNFVKLLRTTFLKEHLERMLLKTSEKRQFHHSCFFLILLKSVVFYVKKIKTYNFQHWTNEIKNKHTWFSRKIFVFYRKWEIENAIVLDVLSFACL